MKRLLPILGGGLVLTAVALSPQLRSLNLIGHQIEDSQSDTTTYFTPQELIEQEYQFKKARRESGYAKADKPNEFAKYQEAIRTKWGEEAPAYAAGYRMQELAKAEVAARKANARTQTLNWVERGPANVPGRTRGVVVLPGDPNKNTWLVGSVAGGIWKTTDAGSSWVHKTPNLPNMATTSLAMSASNDKVVYAGTGESFAGYNGVNGDGIFKSTDGGETWSQLASTAKSDNFTNINRLLVDQQNHQVLLAATSPSYWGKATSKIMKSVDGGNTWYKVYDAGLNAQNRTIPVEQVIAHPADFKIQYAAVNGVGVIKSTDAGETWKPAGAMEASGRIELAIAPSDPSRIFASVVGSVSGMGSDLYVSDDGAATWRLVSSLYGDRGYDYLGGQGWYDNTLAVNPFNKDEVYVAGVNMFRVRVGQDGLTVPSYLGVKQNNTSSFLSFVNFGGDLFSGQMSKGKAAAGKFANVEIRFGAGRKQKAHRFTVPATSGSNGDGGAGVPAADYHYQDYVEVPFQVWDVDNNRQLMVSFRDQERNGVFNLNDRQFSDENSLDNREYLYIHGVAYSTTPAADVAKNAGHEFDQLFFLWPTLTTDASWNPNSLPESDFKILWGRREARNGTVALVCDAYNSFGGPNGFKQTANSDAVTGVHPDHHNLIMVPVSESAKTFKIINANDGGLYVSKAGTQPGMLEGDWKFAGNGYNTTQLYGVDKKPGSDEYLFGSQDNGTWRTPASKSSDASTKYLRALGGDGFEVIWHYNDPKRMLGTIYYNAIYRTMDGGNSWGTATSGLSDKGAGTNSPFITKLATHKATPDVVFAAGKQGVWRTVDFGTKWTLSPISSNWTIGSFTDLEVSVANPNIVWAGSGMSPTNKFHVSTDGGKTFKATNNYAVQQMGVTTGIFTHATEDSTAYALFSFSKNPKILKTTNLGQSWEDITGFEGGTASNNGFPDVAVYTLLVMPHNPNQIWAGTEIGLVESLNGGKTWALANNGLPTVSIWDMKIVDDQVVIGTHARGIWTVTLDGLKDVRRNPTLEVSATESGDLALKIGMRSAYLSTKIIINNLTVSSWAANRIKDTTIILDGIQYTGKDLSIRAVSQIQAAEYPSNQVDIKKGAMPLGFEEQKLSGQLAFSVYPNPAGAVTNLRYYMPKAGKVRLRVLDLSGRIVDEMQLGHKSEGEHKFPYAISPAAGTNMLILQLQTDTETRILKLLR